MRRAKKLRQEEDLLRHLNSLDVSQSPAIVHSSRYMNLRQWQNRVQVAKDFYGSNYQQNVQQIQATAVTAAVDAQAQATSAMPTINVVRQAKDGVAHGFDQAPAGVKPVIMIAADAKILGGKPFGRGTVGNAQEEGVCNNVALVPAMVSKGLMSHINSHGKICATRQFTQMMESRQALHMSNVPAINPNTGQAGQVDTVQVVAPDLRQTRDMSLGDIKQYAQEMYKVYRNALDAMVKHSNPSQPLVITFPGSGVFAGPKDRPDIQELAREVQGLCLRQAMQDTPGLAGRNVSATFVTPGSGADHVHKVATGATAARHGLDRVVSTAIAGMSASPASAHPVSAQSAKPVIKSANRVVHTASNYDGVQDLRRAAKANGREASRDARHRRQAAPASMTDNDTKMLARLMQQMLELNYQPTVSSNHTLQFKSEQDAQQAKRIFGGNIKEGGLSITQSVQTRLTQALAQSQDAYRVGQAAFKNKYQLQAVSAQNTMVARNIVVGTIVPRSVNGMQPEGVLRFGSSAEAERWLKDNGLQGQKMVRELPNGESALFFSKQQMKDQLGLKPRSDLTQGGVFAPRDRQTGLDQRSALQSMPEAKPGERLTC